MERYYSRGRMSWFGVVLMIAFSVACKTSFAAPVYSTQFEQAQGYNPTFTLVGQGGWQGSDDTSVCNGLVAGIFAGLGQQAYIGFFPADPPLNGYNVWQPIDLAPIPTNTPIVRFAVEMSIIDSSTTDRDCFRWSVYNLSQKRLFSIDFDNADLTINYLLEDGLFVSTGRFFTNDVRYTLVVTMDFGRNLWNASLNNTVLVQDQPITTMNSALNLGDIDAVWVYRQSDAPGDNWMVFDNYTVTLEQRQDASLTALGNLGGQFSLRLTGQPNRNYAIEASTSLLSGSWLALRTNNTSSAGFFDFVDTSSPGLSQRFYRGRLVP